MCVFPKGGRQKNLGAMSPSAKKTIFFQTKYKKYSENLFLLKPVSVLSTMRGGVRAYGTCYLKRQFFLLIRRRDEV